MEYRMKQEYLRDNLYQDNAENEEISCEIYYTQCI